ncbi:MAG: DUF928 domain-containing protein [Stenomitos frigidus ULC029]
MPSAPARQAQRRRRSLSWRVRVRPSLSRIGGFSRSVSSCDNRTQITAFVPPPRADEKIAQKDGAIDTTLLSHPTFWVYLTAVPQGTPMQFTLQNEQFGNREKDLYDIRFESSGRSGVLGIRLPKEKPGLEVGKRYVWQMAIICETSNRSADRVLGSWIQRLDPAQIKPTQGFNPKPLLQELARASEQDQPALYAGLGVWQDIAVATKVRTRHLSESLPWRGAGKQR